MTSFMSEHTAEFYLVPRFRDFLSAGYPHVLPFFYWKTREGNTLSHGDNFPALVTVCAMFPRRPKVYGEYVEMTVNPEVYLMSEYLRQAGIPAFLGFPEVTSFSEFAAQFECCWLLPNSQDMHYSRHKIISGVATTEGSNLLCSFHNEKEIYTYIEANAIKQAWGSLLDVLFDVHSKINQEEMIRSRFRFGPPYKPVYFVMW